MLRPVPDKIYLPGRNSKSVMTVRCTTFAIVTLYCRKNTPLGKLSGFHGIHKRKLHAKFQTKKPCGT